MGAVEGGQTDVTNTHCVLAWKLSVSKIHAALKNINF